ncbi:hypothetical protein [Enterobacter sp. C4G1]|uniref:hypothetical protein n=1 Tax=Enterobacter sp. C4G1 TaxID=3458724 RepID=UPI004068DA3F
MNIINKMKFISMVWWLALGSAGAAVPEISLKMFVSPPSQFVSEHDRVEITNLPKIPGQGAIGICYAYVSAVMLTAENCRALHEDCTQYKPDQIFSPFSLVKFMDYSDDDNAEQKAVTSQKNKIQADEGGNAATIMQVVALDTGTGGSLSCAAKEKVMPDFTDDAATMREYEMWQNVRKIYVLLNPKARKVDLNCPDCIEAFLKAHQADFLQLKAIFPLLPDDKRKQVQLLTESTYHLFLGKLVVPKACYRLSASVLFENMGKVKMSIYPESVEDKKDGQTTQHTPPTGNYADSMTIIKSVLNGGRPVALEGICMDKKIKGKSCNNAHAVVISGFKTVCDKNNHCLDVLKVVNSWGDAWQKENNDGWLEAKPLLDSTLYQTATLSWFTDLPKNKE